MARCGWQPAKWVKQFCRIGFKLLFTIHVQRHGVECLFTVCSCGLTSRLWEGNNTPFSNVPPSQKKPNIQHTYISSYTITWLLTTTSWNCFWGISSSKNKWVTTSSQTRIFWQGTEGAVELRGRRFVLHLNKNKGARRSVTTQLQKRGRSRVGNCREAWEAKLAIRNLRMAEQHKASNINSHMRWGNIVWVIMMLLSLRIDEFAFIERSAWFLISQARPGGQNQRKIRPPLPPESRWRLIPKILKTHIQNLFICLIISSYYRHLLLYPVTIFAKCCPVHSGCLWGKRPAMPGRGCRKHNSALTQLFQRSVKCQLLYAYPLRAELRSRPVILFHILHCLCLVFEISH